MTQQKFGYQTANPVVPGLSIVLRPAAEPDFWDLVEREITFPYGREQEFSAARCSPASSAEPMVLLG